MGHCGNGEKKSNKHEQRELTDMTTTEKEMIDVKKEKRKKKILALANKACDRNDKALRKLSKN